MEDKMKFVTHELTALVMAIDSNVCNVTYKKIEKVNCEIVTLHFTNGHTRKIDVSCDSLLGIASDVLKKLA